MNRSKQQSGKKLDKEKFHFPKRESGKMRDSSQYESFNLTLSVQLTICTEYKLKD